MTTAQMVAPKARIAVSDQNGKMGKVWNISLTPGEIKDGGSCPNGVPCSRCEDGVKCYAERPYDQYPNTREAWDRNLDLWREDPEDFERQLIAFWKSKRVRTDVFRFHTAGDIPDASYLRMMARMAVYFPETSFYAYTKAFDLLAPVSEILTADQFPNLNILCSEWVKPCGLVTWEVPEELRKRHAVATVDLGQRITGKTFKCPGTCESCKACAKLGAGWTILLPLI